MNKHEKLRIKGMKPPVKNACCALARTPARSDRGVLELFCSTFLFQDKKVERTPSRVPAKEVNLKSKTPHQGNCKKKKSKSKSSSPRRLRENKNSNNKKALPKRSALHILKKQQLMQ
jgi:hypothetical protein